MRRVVVTGLGITSSIGNNAGEVTDSLKAGRSGIVFAEDYAKYGFRSQVHGPVKIDLDAAIDRRQKRFMGDGAAFAYLAMEQAIADSGLEQSDIVNPRTGLIVGSGSARPAISCRPPTSPARRARRRSARSWCRA